MTHVAFLRAVNVGGRGVVKMDALRDAFAAAGCGNTRTFIASGNVLFDASPRDVRRLVAAARARVGALLGAEPDVIVRTGRELREMVENRPITQRQMGDGATLYVALMAAAPRSTPELPLLVEKEGLELVAIRGADAFVVCRRLPNGRSGSPGAFVEARLGVRATTRNWNTIERIVSLVG